MKQTLKLFILITSTFLFSLTYAGCKKENVNESSFYSTIESDISPAPGRSNVKGTVLSETDERPLENVEVWLCTDVSVGFIFNCTGKSGQIKTDQNGVYWFRNLPPGKYAVAIKSPREKGQFYLLAKNKGIMLAAESAPMTLAPGQTIEVAPQKIAPAYADFPKLAESPVKLTHPAMGSSLEERKPTLSWEKVIGANQYEVNIFRKEGTNSPGITVNLDDTKKSPVSTKNTSITPPNGLPNGIYIWTVSAYKGYQKLAESDEGFFIIGEIPL